MTVVDGLQVAGDAGGEFWPNDGVFGKGVVVWRSHEVGAGEVIVCWISVGVFGKKINATESGKKNSKKEGQKQNGLYFDSIRIRFTFRH